MSTDTAQAQAHEILNEPFPNIPAMRRCIAGLLADIEERDRQLAQAREALAEAIEIISSGLESEGDLEAG